MATADHIPTLLRAFTVALLLGALAIALIAPAQASAAACRHAKSKPTSTSVRNVERATRCLINKRRANHGLKRLDASNKLDESAGRHSRDMEDRNYFSHTSLDGSSMLTRIRRTGYLNGSNNWTVGENIAWQRGRQATPKAVVDAWMNSSSHRSTILRSSFRDVGIGIARGAPVGRTRDAGTYTTDFGRN